jgi:flagellar export protein FliJ
MKPFHFRLQRVLEMRETEVKTEEAQLERLYAERTRIERDRDDLTAGLERMCIDTRSQQFVHPSHLVALDQYKSSVKRELQRFAERIKSQQESIEQQQARVVTARARVRLLDKLRERRQTEWNVERDRELDELAADFSTAQWLRQR